MAKDTEGVAVMSATPSIATPVPTATPSAAARFMRSTRVDFIFNAPLMANDDYVQKMLDERNNDATWKSIPTVIRLGPISPRPGSLYEKLYIQSMGTKKVREDRRADRRSVVAARSTRSTQSTPVTSQSDWTDAFDGTGQAKLRKINYTEGAVEGPGLDDVLDGTVNVDTVNVDTVNVGTIDDDGATAGASKSKNKNNKVIELEHVNRFCFPNKCVVEDDTYKIKLVIPATPKLISYRIGSFKPPVLEDDVVIYRRSGSN